MKKYLVVAWVVIALIATVFIYTGTNFQNSMPYFGFPLMTQGDLPLPLGTLCSPACYATDEGAPRWWGWLPAEYNARDEAVGEAANTPLPMTSKRMARVDK